MNITYKRPRRKSMLGTRLSILHDNIELGHEDSMKPPPAPVEVEPPLETKSFYDTRSRKAREDNESLTQVLNNIETLLEKNAQTLQTLMQEREQLENIERMLKEKINLTLHNNESETCKENLPPSNNTPQKSKHTSNKANDFPNDNTPAKVSSNREGHKNDDEFTAPLNPDIDLMRTSIKFLKTPRPSRQPRKSIMLTPHSFSFSIHKQFESLKE